MKKITIILTLIILIQSYLFSDVSPRTAVLASIFIPGGGQLYTGRTTRALFFSLVQGTLISSTLYSHFIFIDFIIFSTYFFI